MSTAREVIGEVMGAVRGVAKKDKNTHQGFNFRGIDAVVNAIGPALRDAGGFIVPTVVRSAHEVAQSAKGGVLNTVRIQVEFSVYGQEGDPISGVVSAEAFDSGDKATAKAMSVAYRTFMLQVFCLPTDEPDPDSKTYNLGEPEVAPETVPVPSQEFLTRLDAAVSVEELTALWEEALNAGFSPTVKDTFTKRKKAIENE